MKAPVIEKRSEVGSPIGSPGSVSRRITGFSDGRKSNLKPIRTGTTVHSPITINSPRSATKTSFNKAMSKGNKNII